MIQRSTFARTRLLTACCTGALLTGTLPLGGCQTIDLGVGMETKQAPLGEPAQLREAGIKALREGELDVASKLFNAALRLDIQNPQLQFLNALTYHIRGVQSDRSVYPLAQQGYQLAIKFDPTNWIARYYLGLLHQDQRQFVKAKAVFADALLYKDDDPDLLYNLASAAYYAQDPQTAEAALSRLREIEPDAPRTLRASAVVLAALGSARAARDFLDRYREKEPNPRIGTHVARRVEDWKKIHARVQQATFRPPTPPNANIGAQMAQFPGVPGGQGFPGAPGQPPVEAGQFPGGQGFPGAPGQPPVEAAQFPGGQGFPGAPGQPNGGGGRASSDDRMVIVDVVIISSQEDITTGKGVNLLNGLQFQFGSSSADAFSRVTSDARDNTTGAGTTTTTFTRALTIPAIKYSLNIANAGSTRNEILARPTLVALAGQKSEFFSGENIKASSVSTSAQSGATEVEKDIGVKLGIIPQFLKGGKIRLVVDAQRTFLQTPSSSVTFSYQLRTSKTTVNASVVLEPGESLILSGLSEKETENIRTGVPGLQDVPLIQYMFSRQTTRDFNKSVLVLITPRLPEYVYRPAAKADGTRGEGAVDELKARYSDWFRPYPNWASVFRHLQNNSLYREFRTGDVSLETWNTQSTLQNRLGKALEFFYY